ncbi:MAG TPA: coproporphyrinogen-III oxidase family protein [Blastocatellia bacterium]|nr:coproporphyrinogen-III oxidase family protein [Blastocatellia bacterium]
MMSSPAGIYIHIPFCERKCTYCNFNTTDFHTELETAYIQALEREIDYWSSTLQRARPNYRKSANSSLEIGDRSRGGANSGLQAQCTLARDNFPAESPGIDSIYFGGGTPSIIEACHLRVLIEACRGSFRTEPDTEITIEINPGTFSPSKIETWLRAGINRASVGVQSFLDRELAALSRTHTADDARRTVDSLRKAGFTNISLDLIAGLPGQTVDDWRYNLDQALRLFPEHLSLYLLEVKEGTQLYGQVKRGALPRPDDDVAAEMYEMICNATANADFEQYEISNFALGSGAGTSAVAAGWGADSTADPVAGGLKGSSAFRSKHNMKYWTGAPFIGMGCGAHSYDGRARWVNVKKTESYIESVSRTGQAIAERTELPDHDRASEALFMGLRLLEGVNLAEFASRYGVTIEDRYRDELRRFGEAGLVEMKNGVLCLTKRGLLLSNEVFVAFI